MDKFKRGQEVEWKWGKSKASGKVTQSFTSDVTRTIEGKEISRKADADHPAYMIKQEDGARVLKKHSELSAKH
ncbi:hypothetical protein GCM10011390_18010 [Aureimonas endophytica]|uniref:Hypervirulence associated protein TUDOR domain-containing protein n=1 Tax=Aureimonas endophytica TaxID=2027858 RepID=A0A917E3J0_9HYPH|nr:DUF2945 domain-containing protein [Aureimonas endophytica]GGD99595.1 hypothetical protein GCM10011390_18010 [Aureimonas endophytica]